MNFSPSFRRWIDVIYQDNQSAVINNGWLSDFFMLSRGVHQGCPLSPLLYCLVAETLGQAIRKDTLISGIQVPGSAGKEAKCSQYADDATLILTDNFSITRAFHVINIFEQGSGSKLNPEKTEWIWVGSNAGQSTGTSSDKMSWKADKIKVLGLYFGNRDLDKDNWSARITKLEKRLNF